MLEQFGLILPQSYFCVAPTAERYLTYVKTKCVSEEGCKTKGQENPPNQQTW